MSARWPRTSRMHHLSDDGLYRNVLSGSPETAAAICLGLFSAASRCFFSSASVMGPLISDKWVIGNAFPIFNWQLTIGNCQSLRRVGRWNLEDVIAYVAFRHAAIVHHDFLWR